MKTIKYWAIGLCLVATSALSAQEKQDKDSLKKAALEREALEKEALLEKNKEYQEESISNIKITKYTVMSKFEPDYVDTPEERIEQKKQRIVDAYTKKGILDTMKISDRKRKKLIKDLSTSPFSSRLSKTVVVDTEFQDEE